MRTRLISNKYLFDKIDLTYRRYMYISVQTAHLPDFKAQFPYFSRYFEAVFPGDYGIPHPPWFFVTKSYWCGTSTSKVDHSQEPTVSSLFFAKQSFRLNSSVYFCLNFNFNHRLLCFVTDAFQSSSKKPRLRRGTHRFGNWGFYL